MDDAARRQLANAARMPFVHKWVAVMPDVHPGIGATIGSVIPTEGAIIPAAVGVDLGCGMMAGKRKFAHFAETDTGIERFRYGENATAVMRHRVALSAEMEIDGMSVDDMLAKIFTTVAAPRL